MRYGRDPEGLPAHWLFVCAVAREEKELADRSLYRPDCTVYSASRSGPEYPPPAPRPLLSRPGLLVTAPGGSTRQLVRQGHELMQPVGAGLAEQSPDMGPDGVFRNVECLGDPLGVSPSRSCARTLVSARVNSKAPAKTLIASVATD